MTEIWLTPIDWQGMALGFLLSTIVTVAVSQFFTKRAFEQAEAHHAEIARLAAAQAERYALAGQAASDARDQQIQALHSLALEMKQLVDSKTEIQMGILRAVVEAIERERPR